MLGTDITRGHVSAPVLLGISTVRESVSYAILGARLAQGQDLVKFAKLGTQVFRGFAR